MCESYKSIITKVENGIKTVRKLWELLLEWGIERGIMTARNGITNWRDKSWLLPITTGLLLTKTLVLGMQRSKRKWKQMSNALTKTKSELLHANLSDEFTSHFM